MSHVRKIALVLTIVVAGFAGWHQGAANADVGNSLPSIDLSGPGSLTLVKGWCNEACTEACEAHEGCDDIRVLGCDCYWLCKDGYDGHTYCTGAVGVNVCNDVAELIGRPSPAAGIISPFNPM